MEKEIDKPYLLVGKCPKCGGDHYTKNATTKVWMCFSCGRHGKLTSNLDEISTGFENYNYKKKGRLS